MIRGSTQLGMVMLGGLLLAVPPVSAQLTNGGFEDAGGSLNGWGTFNNAGNVLPETITPRTGSAVAKVYGGFNGYPNYSGFLQNLPASAGQQWTASLHVRHNSGDSLVGTSNVVSLKVEFYQVFGGVYGTSDMLAEYGAEILNSASGTNTWLPESLIATAPAGTVEARIAIVFTQTAAEGGAALFDDIVFEPDTLPPPITWDLIWQDEFDGPTIDTSKWRVEDIHLIKNNELQYYAPDDVYIDNGKLVLRSQERTYWGFDTNNVWRQFDYTSGLVESRDRFGTAFGKIEVRAKLPGTQGMWPAHWMLPTSNGWPPEIDIMEVLGHIPTQTHMSHHWGVWPSVMSWTTSYNGPDFTAGFHTFTVEWLPDRLDWYVDDVLRGSHTSDVPQEPFYIILNTAVGGDWPGNPDGSTVFPQFHEIDYVRVYVPSDSGAPLQEITDTTPGTGTADGALNGGEYVGTASGINFGLGDRMGQNSEFYIDSGADGTLSIAFDSQSGWLTPSQYGAVIYIDSVAGGFSSTFELTDNADRSRRMASGKGTGSQRGDLHFALGFRADFAIVLEPNNATLYQLGVSSHTPINGAALGSPTDMFGGTDVRYEISGNLKLREFEARLSHLAVAQGGSFEFVVTMLNGDSGFRSNEFVGVAPGNPWDGFNPGNSAAVLKEGDFIRLNTTVDICGSGDLDCSGDLTTADVAPFVQSLLDPAAYEAAHTDCVICTGDINLDGDVNGDDVDGFVGLMLGN